MARSFLGKLKRGLFMTHNEFLEKAGEALRRTGPVEPADIDRLEEALIASDAGVELSLRLVEKLRNEVRSGRITTAEDLRPAVREQLLTLLHNAEEAQSSSDPLSRPRITLLVGVNGTGKTTTAAKLAKRKQERGTRVILAAADTSERPPSISSRFGPNGSVYRSSASRRAPTPRRSYSTPSRPHARGISTRSWWIPPGVCTRIPIS